MLNPFVAMEIISIIYISIILITILAKWKNTEKSTKLFALNIVLVIIGTVCDAVEISTITTSLHANLALVFITFIIGGSLAIVFSYYCMFQANAKEHLISIKIPRIILIVNGLAILLITIAYFSGKLFVVNEDEVTAGIFLYIYLLIELLTSVFLLIMLLIKRKKIGTRVFIGLLVLISAPAVGLCLEYILPYAYISYSTLSISILIQYVLIQSRVVSEAEMRNRIESEVSRTDVMTGLSNRRAYTEYLDSFTEPVCCGAMFFDVNGLKMTNDTKGHIAGDNLIISFAGLLKDKLSGAKLFRISGDEFVAIYYGLAKKKLFEEEKVAISVAITKNNSIASMGSGYKENEDILQIITEAEQNMYLDKQEYYRKSGCDRRKH